VARAIRERVAFLQVTEDSCKLLEEIGNEGVIRVINREGVFGTENSTDNLKCFLSNEYFQNFMEET
jgi:hypothetical protein